MPEQTEKYFKKTPPNKKGSCIPPVVSRFPAYTRCRDTKAFSIIASYKAIVKVYHSLTLSSYHALRALSNKTPPLSAVA